MSANATLDWSACPVLESVPGKVSGAWVFRGTRVPVSAILTNLKHSTLDELAENFPPSPAPKSKPSSTSSPAPPCPPSPVNPRPPLSSLLMLLDDTLPHNLCRLLISHGVCTLCIKTESGVTIREVYGNGSNALYHSILPK